MLDSELRVSRLNIFLFDFRQAREFAQYILKKRLHSIKTPTAKAKLVHLAFNTSLIISYARPFRKSNEPQGLSRVALTTSIGFLEKKEKALHAQVMSKRDQAFAHSDALSHEIAGFNYESKSKLKLYKSAFDPLPIEETLLLRRIIDKWISHIESLRTAAKQNDCVGQ